MIWNHSNVGFAEAQNQGIRSSQADWVLTLNPDLLMEEDFLRRLVDAGELDRGAGAVCGKLLSIGPGFQRLPERRIDSTGLFFTPAMRHFDRGWHSAGRWRVRPGGVRVRRLRGGALYRREMIDDVSIGGDFFDPDFFAYREDADVCVARATAWLALYLHAGGSGRGTCAAWCPGNGDRSPVDQHALGEESLPDADQECDAGLVPALLAADDGAGSGSGGGMRAGGTAVAAGILAGGKMLEYDVGAAARNHEAGAGSATGTWYGGSVLTWPENR